VSYEALATSNALIPQIVLPDVRPISHRHSDRFPLSVGGEGVELCADRALFWTRTRTLFVADVHLGKAAAFRAGGVPLPRGATSLTLTLPHGDMCLLARSNAGRLRAEDESQQTPSLGKLELQVPGDKKPSVVLEIGPPPEISDEVPAPGGKKR